MKLTQVLCKHHLGRLIKKMWYEQRNRKISQTDTEEYVRKLGIQIQDVSELIKPEKKYEKIHIEYLSGRFNEKYPDLNEQACLMFNNNNVLQEGLPQAQILTNTICPSDFPSSMQELPDLPEYVDDIVKRAVYNSTIFDAHQQKLRKRKNPDKPMWVFPRDYGITNTKKVMNLSMKFLQICESISGPNIANKRYILYNEPMKLNLDKETDLIQFNLTSDITIMSTSPLESIEDPDNNTEIDLPNIYPLHHTISLEQSKVFENQIKDIYPIRTVDTMLPWKNIHTIFVYCTSKKIKNLTELPVTESQIISRTMLKSYTAAASCARYRFGKSVKKLPEPITIQSIQTDGKNYQFFVFQLNSLDTDDLSTRNFWYTLPSSMLYEKAQYDNGRPIVEGYNPEVFKRIVAFYRNGS